MPSDFYSPVHLESLLSTPWSMSFSLLVVCFLLYFGALPTKHGQPCQPKQRLAFEFPGPYSGPIDRGLGEIRRHGQRDALLAIWLPPMRTSEWITLPFN